MTEKQIQRRRLAIESKIKHWERMLSDLQGECAHPNVISKHGGNTGNYCPADNVYWTSYNCPDCGRRWTVYKE